MSKIIVISGKAGSGKSFLANHLSISLEKVYGFRVMQLAFADTLKMVCREIYGWDGEKDPRGRELLQRVGTDIVHPNNQNCWVNCMREIITGLTGEYDYFIIPDARFPHEIEGITGLYLGSPTIASMHTVRVIGKTNLTGEMSEHASETALDHYHFGTEFDNTEHDVNVFFHKLYHFIEKTLL